MNSSQRCRSSRSPRAELPALLRVLEALPETHALLVAGEVQEDLQNGGAFVGPSSRSNSRMCSKRRSHTRFGDEAAHAELPPRPHSGRAVEDGDLAARRAEPVHAPEVVVSKLIRARLTERDDAAALGVDAAEHVADRPVLSRCVHALQHEQNGARALREEPVVEDAQTLDDLTEAEGRGPPPCPAGADADQCPGRGGRSLGADPGPSTQQRVVAAHLSRGYAGCFQQLGANSQNARWHRQRRRRNGRIRRSTGRSKTSSPRNIGSGNERPPGRRADEDRERLEKVKVSGWTGSGDLAPAAAMRCVDAGFDPAKAEERPPEVVERYWQ